MKRPMEYPKLSRIVKVYQPQRFFGRELVWEAKEDGSNLMIWLDDEGALRISSRNQIDASSDFIFHFKNCPQGALVEELIRDQLKEYNKQLVVFGELCRKGKSPTRIVLHPETKFVVFDIVVLPDTWLNYVAKHQLCYHYNIPLVEALGTCTVANIDEILAFRDQMLEVVLARGGLEGVVVKTQYGERVVAKEKIDTPKLEKLPKFKTDQSVQLPPLPESEIWGAVDKAFVDLGKEDFMNVKIAMPVVAKYIAQEANKHLSQKPKNMFKYYQQRCEELASEAL